MVSADILAKSFLQKDTSIFLPAALAEAGLELTLSVSKTQMSHLEASNAISAQSKDV